MELHYLPKSKLHASFMQVCDLKKIIECRKILLGKWPTAIVSNPYLDNFWIKRDDLSGYGRGGTKTRKLEGVFAYILDKGYSDVIIVVPNVSNLRLDIELFANENNVNFHLIVANDPFIEEKNRKKPVNKEKVFYTVIGTSRFEVLLQYVTKYLRLLFQKKKAAWFFPSMAHPSSVMGAALGLLELMIQYDEMDVPFPKHIFISGCTGTAASGLILTNSILRKHSLLNCSIHTVKVFPIPLKLWIFFLLNWTKRKYKLSIDIKLSDIKIHVSQKMTSYGINNSSLNSICIDVKKNRQIDVDPIYGAKTWLAMNNFVNAGYYGEGLIFWHCGFTPDWKIL